MHTTKKTLLVLALFLILLPHAAKAVTCQLSSSSPATVQPGQTEKIIATATTNTQSSNYSLIFDIYLNNRQVGSKTYSNVRINAGSNYTNSYNWQVPTNAAGGTYQASVALYKGSTLCASAQSSFTVNTAVAVNGQCGPANGAISTSMPTSGLCNAGNPSAVTGGSTSNIWSWSCIGINGGSTASCATAVAASVANTGLLIPLYEYPITADYNTLVSLKKSYPSVPVYVVLDPTTQGPGNAVDPNYAAAVTLLQGAGIVVIGYVDTSYTKRTTAAVETDIANWKKFYPTINGIFLDEMSNTTSAISYYAGLNTYLHSIGLTISFGNAGAQTPAAFFDDNAVDNVIVSETSGYPGTSAISNGGVGNRSSKSVIVYNAPFNATQITTASQYNGLIWFTNATGANPYGSLPSYIAQLFAALAAE